MNFIASLHDFFTRASGDERLNMTHICVYMALYDCWNKNQFVNPVNITRAEIMRLSKVNAKTTYHKCMKELHRAGYIYYRPSYHPHGSLVYMASF